MRGLNFYGLILLVVVGILVTGCWNYREIEKMGIVVGMGIDKDLDTGKILITSEIIDVKFGEKESRISTTMVKGEGETIFDAIRNTIKLTGKKLYFSHIKVLIISNDIAKEGVIPVLDFINRHSETRYDMDVLIAEGNAATIFEGSKGVVTDILSINLDDKLNSEGDLSKAVKIDLWLFVNDMIAKDQAAILPLIHIETQGEINVPVITGTAVFKEDKMIGSLNAEETKLLLFVNNKLKGGVFITHDFYTRAEDKVVLEISKNDTNVKPQSKDGNIFMAIKIQTEVAMAENVGDENLNDESTINKLEIIAEKELETEIVTFIQKVQKNFGSDIFGFGVQMRIHMPTFWEEIKNDWPVIFAAINVQVDVKMIVKNSGFTSQPIKVGI